jgi:hypothetical protein
LGDAVDDLPPDGLVAGLDHGVRVLFGHWKMALSWPLNVTWSSGQFTKRAHLDTDEDAVVINQNSATCLMFWQPDICVSPRR